MWVPAVMFALLITGAAVIVLNYLGILPGEQQNSLPAARAGRITAGFVFATIYR